MIRAKLYINQHEQLTGFSVKGHAGYEEEGRDIVCAAVSVLTITCINSLDAVCGIQPVVKGGKDGLLEARLPASLSQQQWHDSQIVLRSLRQGLSDVVEQYPQFVQLSMQEWRETQ